MKNQYVGDYKDYLKYGILRCLAKCGFRPHVCWMLTDNDDSGNGGDLRHLRNPSRWRSLDPVLYDHLNAIVLLEQFRDVARIRERNVIPSATFFEAILTDDDSERKKYFERFQTTLPACDLVFFDPDTGIERPSKARKDQPESEKYVYWDELRECYISAHSLLIFQYFYMPPRVGDLESRGNEIIDRLAVPGSIIALRTSAQVVFFLVPSPERFEAMSEFSAEIATHWHPHITYHLVGSAADRAGPTGDLTKRALHQSSVRGSAKPRGKTTTIGYVNRNNQEVICATGLPGTDHGQYIYVLRCRDCGHEYGANGSDIFQRKCPKCQGGKPGLPYDA